MEWKPGSGEHPWIAKTSKAKSQFEAMTGYEYIIEIRNWFINQMSKEQITALLYHELRHIGDGSIIKHDIEDWNCMVATLGSDWATTQAQIIDILNDDFEQWDYLRKVGTQVSIFDNIASIKKAKEVNSTGNSDNTKANTSNQ
jgi:hypothetical protein